MHTYGGNRETFRIYEYKNLVTGERAHLWVNKANKVRYQGNRSISEWHGNFSDDDEKVWIGPLEAQTDRQIFRCYHASSSS